MATLVLKRNLQEILDEQPLKVLEKETLPAYLPKRRWFAGAGTRQPKTRILYAVPFGDSAYPALLSEVEVKTGDHVDYYQLPLGFIGEDDSSVLSEQLAMARIRRGRQVGLLTDAFTMESFIRALITRLQSGKSLDCERGVLEFRGSEPLSAMELEEDIAIRYLSAEQSNSSVIIGGRMVLKLIRHLHPGVHPELEIGSYLTDRGFENCAQMLGQVTRTDSTGESYALMVLQAYLDNQGDAWEWTLVTLDRAIRDQMAGGVSQHENQYGALAELEEFSAALGQRLGEMHVALASPTDNSDFAPEPTREEDTQGWAQSIRTQLDAALEALEASESGLDDDDKSLARELRKQRQALGERIDQLAAKAVGGLRFRVHGDLHLGQVLVVKGDAYLIDFEGEPSRPLQERRAKLSPYKDVTGVLRSIDYAVAMARLNAQSTDNSDEAEQSREEIVSDYRERASTAFLQAYRQATTEIAHDWADADGEDAAIALFSLEKAAYEILYETEHRPTWISVPLRGLSSLVQQLEDNT